ncbi:MAG: hypothetical protein IJO33_02915 [Bacilli bacterium]|nr:hypothetical protein [Bacilli bacterium]
MESYDDLKRKAQLNEYLRNNTINEYGKEISKNTLSEANNLEAQSKIIEFAKKNVKCDGDQNIVYRPQQKRVSKIKMKSDILILIQKILSILAVLGIVGGIGMIANIGINNWEDHIISVDAEKKISSVMAGCSDGRNYDRGEHWYEEERYVNEIIEKESYKNSETLYVQLARIYTGLENETSESTPKLNDQYGHGYTPEEWIKKIYGALREKVLEDYGMEIGPQELMDFLNNIGKLPYDRDPYEVMLEYYDKYKTAIENQVRVTPDYVVLLPVEEVLEAEFGVVLD